MARDYAAEYEVRRRRGGASALFRQIASGHPPKYYQSLSGREKRNLQWYHEDHPKANINARNFRPFTKDPSDIEALRSPWRQPERMRGLHDKIQKYRTYFAAAAQGLRRSSRRVGSVFYPGIEMDIGWGTIIPTWSIPGAYDQKHRPKPTSRKLFDYIDMIPGQYLTIRLSSDGSLVTLFITR